MRVSPIELKAPKEWDADYRITMSMSNEEQPVRQTTQAKNTLISLHAYATTELLDFQAATERANGTVHE